MKKYLVKEIRLDNLELRKANGVSAAEDKIMKFSDEVAYVSVFEDEKEAKEYYDSIDVYVDVDYNRTIRADVFIGIAAMFEVVEVDEDNAIIDYYNDEFMMITGFNVFEKLKLLSKNEIEELVKKYVNNEKIEIELIISISDVLENCKKEIEEIPKNDRYYEDNKKDIIDEAVCSIIDIIS